MHWSGRLLEIMSWSLTIAPDVRHRGWPRPSHRRWVRLPAEVMFFTATMHCAAPRPVRLVCVSSLLTGSAASTPDGPYIELHQSVPTHQNTPRAVLETCPVRPSYGRSTSRIGRSECLYEEIYLPFGSGAQETGCTSLHGRRGAAPTQTTRTHTDGTMSFIM